LQLETCGGGCSHPLQLKKVATGANVMVLQYIFPKKVAILITEHSFLQKITTLLLNDIAISLAEKWSKSPK
jgi:hypothetical protein